MSLDFTYTVLKVNTDSNTMEVQYSTAGHEIIVISMMIPYADQDLVQYITSCAPQAQWANSTRTIQTVVAGISGTVTPPAPVVSGNIVGNITEVQLEAAIQRVLDRNAEGTV